jgi:hypothetical protein
MPVPQHIFDPPFDIIRSSHFLYIRDPLLVADVTVGD